ncbi:MAG: DNA starvation/stationary phase protection protein [Planctomycetota bacterium]|nr:MAG: DNA starvation/stationary phase protection protein [Planctomycetota bacterium]
MTTSKTTETAQALSKLLADSYTLYLKTHNFHWNVRGPMFSTLHLMFETQYTELALAVDEIAERIRAVGAPAPGTYREFAKLTSIQEPEGPCSATMMLEQLADDQTRVADSARAVFKAAEGAGDQASADLAVRRIETHEKNAWMLTSHLE